MKPTRPRSAGCSRSRQSRTPPLHATTARPALQQHTGSREGMPACQHASTSAAATSQRHRQARSHIRLNAYSQKAECPGAPKILSPSPAQLVPAIGHQCGAPAVGRSIDLAPRVQPPLSVAPHQLLPARVQLGLWGEGRGSSRLACWVEGAAAHRCWQAAGCSPSGYRLQLQLAHFLRQGRLRPLHSPTTGTRGRRGWAGSGPLQWCAAARRRPG